MPNMDIQKYKTQRDRLKKQYESERVGNQSLYADQAKLFQPIIETQKETAKNLQEKIYFKTR